MPSLPENSHTPASARLSPWPLRLGTPIAIKVLDSLPAPYCLQWSASPGLVNQALAITLQKPLLVAELSFLLALTKWVVPGFSFGNNSPIAYATHDILLSGQWPGTLWESPDSESRNGRGDRATRSMFTDDMCLAGQLRGLSGMWITR